MKYLRMGVLCIYGLLSTLAWAGPPSTYQNQTLRIIDSIDNMLISSGYCSDKNDCIQKKLAFAGRTSTGFEIEIYQVSDPKLIHQIISACISSHAENNQRIEITLTMYRQPHKELMGIHKWLTRPIVSLKLKGEK